VTGELCQVDQDCCGGAGSGTLGEGSVTCEKEAGATYGRCRNPSAGTDGTCNPQGNICHFQDYACNISSSRNNCCGDVNKQLDPPTCRLDALGIPRCHAIGDCVPAGEICSMSADCCEGLPCVPDAQGVLRCGAECRMEGESCTFNGDCGPPLECIIPVGSSQGVCGTSTVECAAYGQACTVDSDCCNQVPCVDNICQFIPR
jgi:hypothetical protein